MRLAILMTWATFGFAAAVDSQEPPPLLLPAPRPMAETAKEPAKTEKTAPEAPQTKDPASVDKVTPAAQTKDKTVPAPPQPKETGKTGKTAPAPKEAKDSEKKEGAEPATPEGKESEKTEEAATKTEQANEPLTPPNAPFMDPRAFSWVQHRLPPPDKPCVEIACQMRMCLGDHRCLREKICDYLFHWPCPSQLLFGKRCPSYP
jgi:hypothetical protein